MHQPIIHIVEKNKTHKDTPLLSPESNVRVIMPTVANVKLPNSINIDTVDAAMLSKGSALDVLPLLPMISLRSVLKK
jgi:hypothetical protein